MADTKTTDLPVLTSLASGDVFHVVDVSDTTDDPEGSDKQISATNVAAGLAAAGGFATDAEVTSAISAHAGASDPHPGYVFNAELSAHTAATTGAHGMTAFGASLVDDANAAAARTTLELGTAATAAQADLLARANHTGTQPASTISDFAEVARDTLATALVAGSGITVTVDDPGNTITIAATGGGSSDPLDANNIIAGRMLAR